MTRDHVFCLRGHKDVIEWYALVNGRVVGATWPDKGSAITGMQTEQRRSNRKWKVEPFQEFDNGSQ